MLIEMLKKRFFIFGCIWLNEIVTFKSSHQMCSTVTLLKKRPWHRCFPVNFVKFLRTHFLQNTSGRLLLHIKQHFLWKKLLQHLLLTKYLGFNKWRYNFLYVYQVLLKILFLLLSCFEISFQITFRYVYIVLLP